MDVHPAATVTVVVPTDEMAQVDVIPAPVVVVKVADPPVLLVLNGTVSVEEVNGCLCRWVLFSQQAF